MRIQTSVSLLISFGLIGCTGVAEGVPRPPSWDTQCTPSEAFYLELASRTTELSQPGEISSDPLEALEQANLFFEAHGVDIRPKALGIEEWSKFTTTFPDTIYVDKDLQGEVSDALRAQIYWHEAVHVRQYEEFGPKRMAILYSFPEGRWALEIQAYRESFRILHLFGVSRDQILDSMPSRAEQLYDNYFLDPMPRECAGSKALEIWNIDYR
jgi:hypothetical protein